MPVPASRSVVGRTLLRDRAYEVLRDAIVDGTLAPGEQLREAELQEWIGVSRTPIREALMRLERSGLVVTRPGRSTTVVPLDDARVHDAVPVVAAMHALAARLAAPKLTSAQLERMRAANEEFADALARGDVDAALAADDVLHDVVIEAATNAALRDTLEQYSPLLRRAERARFRDPAATTVLSSDLHDQLIDALAAGDAERAAIAALATWESL
ncbi:GntR family transcriptional regulator [Ornithinimicrobium sp. Y1694]|uniref:GntR family transcriptional regulator n=1 Tax=Ornithinimicrobium sp. Y1694 TaxID=3418590 RepID=UPI003CF51FC0